MQIFSVDASIFKRNKSLQYLPISNIQGFIKWLIEVHIFAKFHPEMVHSLFPFCPVIQARRSIYGASGVLSPHCYTEQGRKVVVVIVLGRSDYSLISMRPTYHFDTWTIIWHGMFMGFTPFLPVLVCFWRARS